MTPPPSRSWQLILPGCLFVAILPFTHTVALRLLLLAVTLGLALRCWSRESRPALPVRRALLGWAAIAVASLAWTIDIEYSRGEVINEIGYAMLAYFSFFALARSDEDLRRLMLALLAAIALASLFAIVSFVRLDDWLVDASIGVGDRNAFSTTISLASVAFIFVLANRRLSPAPLPVVWSVWALGLAAASLTLNRTMWPALGAAAIVFLLAHTAGRLRRPRNRLLVVTLVVMIAAISASQFLLTSMIKRSEESASQGVVTTVVKDERIRIWTYALQRAAERPLYGYGYGRGILRKDFRAEMGNELAWHAHNVLLNHAISVGLPGLAAYCLMLAALGAAFVRLVRQHDAHTRSLGAFGLALLACMIVRSLADDTIVRENALLFWSLAGMALGAGMRRLDASQPGAAVLPTGSSAVARPDHTETVSAPRPSSPRPRPQPTAAPQAAPHRPSAAAASRGRLRVRRAALRARAHHGPGGPAVIATAGPPAIRTVRSSRA